GHHQRNRRGRARAARRTARAHHHAVMSLTIPLAHGIGGIRDPVLPDWLMYYAAALTLILSFVALGLLSRTPLLEGRDRGRPLSGRWQRLILWTGWRVVLGALSVGLLILVWLAALGGKPDAGDTLAPTFVWVIFWLGLVPIVVVFGNLWSVLSPWKAAADAVAWVWTKAGRTWEPAAAAPRPPALAILVYSWITWAGMLLYGRQKWVENAEAFQVYFGLFALIAPFAV